MRTLKGRQILAVGQFGNLSNPGLLSGSLAGSRSRSVVLDAGFSVYSDHLQPVLFLTHLSPG